MRGLKSVHQDTANRLRRCGVTDEMITQGIGDAKASAGTHHAVARYQGHLFGHCIDLSTAFRPNRDNFDRLVTQGFAPFYRNWWRNRHWHIIDAVGLPATDGSRPDHLPLVNAQLRDWINCRDGLRGHKPLVKAWCPSGAQRELIRKHWVAHTDFGRDDNTADPWAREAWEWATNKELLDGTRPRDYLTRQEFAAVAHRLLYVPPKEAKK